MKHFVIACVVLALVCSTAWAGVVIEMEVKSPGSSDEAGTDKIYAQGQMARMDPHSTVGSGNMSVVFRDDTLWVVDHDKKTCQKIDKEGMEQLSAELGGAMKQMEAELAKLPPEQRAMMEKMMKGKMPAGMGQEAPPRRIEAGAAEQVGEYSCTVQTLFAGDEKVWEVCAADETAAGAVAEAMEAFRAMSRFTEELRDILQQGPLSEMMETPFQDVNELGGFPVRSRTFANGQVASETTLRSVTRQDLGEDVFSIPKGYKVKDLADEMKRGR
jgi:hypothetical protein